MHREYISPTLIWFGAAVSIAEIITGTLFAPLGFAKGIFVILIGHVIGCFLMYLVGLIGIKTGMGTMMSTAKSFGKIGSAIFASLNGLQLIGWTGVMIFSGSKSANMLIPSISVEIWSLIIALLISLWLILKFHQLSIIPMIVMALLFVLSIFMSVKVFKGNLNSPISNDLSFWNALELSIAMPLSWLPLIGDYTQNSNNNKIPLISSVTYFISSSWMYIVGLGCAIFVGKSDFAQILANLGLGISGLIIIIFSTVTTTFLDAFSCGESFSVLKLNKKIVSILCIIIGLILSLVSQMNSLESFLYLISSIFVPMAAIQITDFFLIKKNESQSEINISNMIIFVLGFALYRILLNSEFFLGVSLPVILATILMVIINNKFFERGIKNVK